MKDTGICRDNSEPVWISTDGHDVICITERPLHRTPDWIEIATWSVWGERAQGQTMALPVAALPALTESLARIERERIGA